MTTCIKDFKPTMLDDLIQECDGEDVPIRVFSDIGHEWGILSVYMDSDGALILDIEDTA